MDASDYNAIASPMHLYEDGELLTREELKRRKDEALVKQEKKSPFLVGTMAQVNQRIGDLDRSLQDYTQLVFDSRMSENEDTDIVMRFTPGSSIASAKHRRREKEIAEIKAFGGCYAINSDDATSIVYSGPVPAVGQAPERIKHVQKITMKEKKKERKKSANESTGAKPKFVELFTFPGYQSSALTPLPHNVTTSEVFNKVAIAHQHAKPKVQRYEDEHSKIVFSHMSQAMLQDIYWWVFLEKFGTKKESQPKFFNRVSHNYIKFILHIQGYHYKESILNIYPDFMAQSIYVAFTETFPDSYKQFGDEFKEFLLQTVLEWMTGILPSPRRFLKWSSELEPAGKKREAAMGKAQPKETKKAPAADDWLATIDAISGMRRGIKKYGSEMSLASRATSHNTSRSRHGRGHGSESSRSEDTNLIDAVADSQAKGKFPRPQAVTKALTPVQEALPGIIDTASDIHMLDGIEEERSTAVTRTGSKTREKSYYSRRRGTTKKETNTIESHPACKGADMVASQFDVRGSCPLVTHYLRTQNLEIDAGQRVNVTRSELRNLPPLDAPTYRDIIKDTFKTIKTIEKGIHKHIKEAQAQHSNFVIQQNKQTKYYRETQANLLNDTKEVKRLSNLLIIENHAERDPAEKSLNDTSKLDKQFDLALQKASISDPPKVY